MSKTAELVTVKTVAKAADCAVSTVSRALRDDPSISEAAKQRIRKVAASLDYRPLRKRRPKSESHENSTSILKGKQLLVLSLGLDRSLISLPVVSSAISGVEDAFSELGVHFQVAHVPDLQAVPPHLDFDQIDGLFLIGALQGKMLIESNSTLLNRLSQIPSVWLLGRPEGCWGDCVGANDVLLGAKAADFLADHGHQNVAFLSPKPDHLIMQNRETGFVSQAVRRGLNVQRFVDPPSKGWTLPVKPPLSTEAVQHLVDQLLKAKTRPTALFAGADSVAAVVYGSLARRGIKVGEEISVISGNNDHAFITGLYPQLTTFDIHAHNIGRLAVRQLETRLTMGNTIANVDLTLEPHLTPGESVRRLNS
ncbi:LacI family DNA-binding transcriptional regulator [Gimesia fumaroli]|uniref:Ribose operon repressor n=1 Tax=Gimesia fumaroli TaxID=2527976 RepID=A0A518I9A2_9PLAN|nr:LacI family DNA-binding transcriptional regulator [Gimesia fumaroli]QDV49677.1 Ribose operon repressor [Gimesia fumaroli]